MTTESTKQLLLSRREAILRVSKMLGGVALVGQTAMLAACGGEEPERQARDTAGAGRAAAQGDALFTDADIALLDEIAETMLPETDTPGAKAAGVGPFMALMVTDTYYPDDQAIFRDGLATIDANAEEATGSDFMSASAEERLAVLETLDAEQHQAMQNSGPDAPRHFFRMMKELALLGYFTSEIGYTEAMRYVESPGRFDPCAPYEDGETIWANHA